MPKGAKYGGRQKGTPNKTTIEIRSALIPIVAGEVEQLPERLNQLSIEKRLDMLCKLLPYVCTLAKDISDEANKQPNPIIINWNPPEE